MNKHFRNGLMLGMFIGFIISSPHRNEWLQKLQCKLNRFRRRIMNGTDIHSL